MTVRDVDVEYTFDDPDEGWFGMARPADVTPAPPAEERTQEDPQPTRAKTSITATKTPTAGSCRT